MNFQLVFKDKEALFNVAHFVTDVIKISSVELLLRHNKINIVYRHLAAFLYPLLQSSARELPVPFSSSLIYGMAKNETYDLPLPKQRL